MYKYFKTGVIAVETPNTIEYFKSAQSDCYDTEGMCP